MNKTSMKFRMAVGIALLLTAGANLAARASQDNGNGNPIEVAPVDAKDLLAPDGESPAARSIARGANDFAFRFAAALAPQESGAENFVCSPYSIWLPLAALVNAAEESKKAALVSTLGAAGMSSDDINTASSRMLYDLTKERDPLKMANAIFVSRNETLQDTFVQTFMDFYRGASIKVDFTSENAVAAVNKWASDNTEGLIDSVVSRFEPDTVAAIANAIYYSARWSREFDPKQTVEDVFHARGGDTKAFYMLRGGAALPYYEDDTVQAMPLSFNVFHNGALLIILPKDGDAPGLLSSMTNDYFERIQRGAAPASGKLLLPRFSVEGGTMDLQAALVALGVPLFDTSGGSTLTGLLKGTTPLYLSSAVQKAHIRVDEKGTTAAAVTVLGVVATAALLPPDTPPFEMICNKPFVFVLYDRTHDGGQQVLFTGMVNKP
jgi:serpin B